MWMKVNNLNRAYELQVQRWELIKENKKVRKKERKHALDQESDQEKKTFFLDSCLGRERAFFLFFLTFLFSFINSHL